MDYGLLGARVHRLGGRSSALFICRSSSGRLSICQMIQGSLKELPRQGRSRLRRNEGIEFVVYSQPGGLTLVYWQEGDLLCGMTSDVDSEETIRLAFSKAVKVLSRKLAPLRLSRSATERLGAANSRDA